MTITEPVTLRPDNVVWILNESRYVKTYFCKCETKCAIIVSLSWLYTCRSDNLFTS